MTMTANPPDAKAGGSAILGATKLVVAIVIVLVAALAILMVLDVIPLSMFGHYAGKLLLAACIVVLASVAIGLLSRIGKSR